MKKIISVLIILILIYMPVVANALTDKEKQEIEAIKKNNEKIMKQMEEMQKQAEKAKLENQKQLEELQKKSAANAASNKPVAVKTDKFDPNEYAKSIPAKNNGKISKIPKKVMDDNELKKYLKDTHSKVEHKLSKNAKHNAEQIIKEVKKQYKNNNTALANAANGCWLTKHPEEALYIMGVACNNDPSNADNLNNYAAFLTMSGAPEKAIPVLNKLNSKYPNNSTVLNNLGQAWFELGDTQEAEKYLDGAIRAFAYHSQANYTKSIIQAAKGNQAEAIAAMKRSLKYSYNQDRAYKLTKMGGQLDGKPDWGFHMPQDALGLNGLILPPFPHSLADKKKYMPQWQELENACQQRSSELEAKIKPLEQRIKAKNDAKSKEIEKASKNFDLKKMQKMAYVQYKEFPPYFQKAMAKMHMELDEERNGYKHEEFRKKHDQIQDETDALKNDMHKELQPVLGAWEEQTGEGMPNESEPYCSQAAVIIDKYTNQINSKWEQYYMEYLDYMKKEYNIRAYYGQYTIPGDDEIELMKLQTQKSYTADIRNVAYHVFFPTNPICSGEIPKGTGGKLADFYDLHCDKHYKLTIPVIGSIETTCNKMTTEFSALPFLKGKWTENLDTNQITKGEALIGLSTGIGSKEMGPLKAEAKIGGGAFVEFDNNGITEFGPYAELKGEVGVNWEKGGAADPYEIHVGDNRSISAGDLPSAAEVGVQARYGFNSGMVSGSGTGLLEGAF